MDCLWAANCWLQLFGFWVITVLQDALLPWGLYQGCGVCGLYGTEGKGLRRLRCVTCPGVECTVC